jgi:serine phosphatase RsbU (regulator of sigma subunit)/catechol 2,3-dioxygenase-like lactoylglutathione lyase family enzyme
MDSSSSIPDRPNNPHLRIQAVNVFVRDQDRSLRFYLDQLGFSLAFDARLQSGQRWVAVAPPDGAAVLALIAPDPKSKAYGLIGRLTDVVFLTDDVLAKYVEWSKRGVRFRHSPRLRRTQYRPATGADLPAEKSPVWGGIFTHFDDVDGNSFALVGFDEVSRQIETQRRALAEKLEAERRTAQEVEIARSVQARLFPQEQPALSTLEYAGLCVQARQVGGDYYDFLNLGREKLGLVIGDIAGKGIAAALLMANLQANLRSQCAIAGEPQRFLESVNRLFYENTADGAYATLFFGEYDNTLRRFRYVNCGHLSALLFRGDGSLQKLDSTATVLGLFKTWNCAVEQCYLFPGDTLVLYTDGVTESFNGRGDEFGEEGLVKAARRHWELPPRRLLTSILNDVNRFSVQEQYDDITLVVARCRDAPD